MDSHGELHDKELESSQSSQHSQSDEKGIATSLKSIDMSKSGDYSPDAMDSADTEKASSKDENIEESEDLDPDVVFWDGPNDPDNPQNWSIRKKGLNIALISAMSFLVPLASSIFAPGVPEVMKEFNSDRLVEWSLHLSECASCHSYSTLR